MQWMVLDPLVRTDYGRQEPWLTVLYQLYTELDASISLSTFVSRLLISALEATQRQPLDYSLLSTLRATSISDLGDIDLNNAILPDLLKELRLEVTIWEPLNLEWCLPSGPDPFTSQFDLQLDHGIIKRIRPPPEAYGALQDTIRLLMQRAPSCYTSDPYNEYPTQLTAQTPTSNTPSLLGRRW